MNRTPKQSNAGICPKRSGWGAGLLCAALALPPFALAAEAEPEPPPAPQAEQENQTDAPEPPPPKQSKSPKRGDIFLPSEEISEDFAVSFPADI
jgi:hypothetical protein